ncbi:MAG: type II toxin-antitoxin system HicA family toxin [Candidatus Liptonbacteria bacterium]|nr:type II toxin-antitoxin system HicA family toxin [Candidatus Liptonbacteria bacterium]
MPVLRPIHYRKFEQFLRAVGCRLVRQEGDHRVWDRPDLLRPVIVRTKKDLPVFEIKSNLRTLGIDTRQYLEIMERL